jgi:heme/copper-type cytochrome/quinol oxidase subunit 4
MSEDPNSSSPQDYQRQTKSAVFFGVCLMVFALITTVVCGYTSWSTRAHIVFALVVATCQIFLQVAYMMHLKNERGIIFKFLVFTVFFVIALFVLTGLANSNPLHDPTFSTSK